MDPSSTQHDPACVARARAETAYLKALGAAVRAAREALGLSQEELGFEAELDRTYVSGIERGVRNPTGTSLRRLASALSTSPGQLLSASDDDQ